MALSCGIVGLPNVGKSTIFKALTKTQAAAENFPFCTIDANIGIVPLEDERLDFLAKVNEPKKKTPTTVKFVDIAGLLKGASKGEGLGNQFLSNIRECTCIAHVVRCFDDSEVIHVREKASENVSVDPESDILTINMELALADLQTVAKREEKIAKNIRALGKDEAKKLNALSSALGKIKPLLQDGRRAAEADLEKEEEEALAELFLLTMKKQLYVANVDEGSITSENKYVETVKKFAKQEDSPVVVISGKFEADLSEITDETEKNEFMKEAGLKSSSLNLLAAQAYRAMRLITFFTAGKDECRAWTVKEGSKAPKAAGVIHTDFEKGFIKAEAYSITDLKTYGSEAKIREAGKYRVEGKDYTVKDGDVLFFKFNV